MIRNYYYLDPLHILVATGKNGSFPFFGDVEVVNMAPGLHTDPSINL